MQRLRGIEPTLSVSIDEAHLHLAAICPAVERRKQRLEREREGGGAGGALGLQRRGAPLGGVHILEAHHRARAVERHRKILGVPSACIVYEHPDLPSAHRRARTPPKVSKQRAGKYAGGMDCAGGTGGTGAGCAARGWRR